MSNPYFQFQQFTIRHDRSALKVGTDGVLLGAWATPHGDSILDIGTGTGLIALMMAQRHPDAAIEGIDIDEASVLQAQENIQASPFADRISIRKADFSDLSLFSKKYTLIISNPPFHKEETLSGNPSRDAARHTNSLPFATLIANAAKLLSSEGHFAVIIPHSTTAEFISQCALRQLYLLRRTDVRSSEDKPCKRTLLEFAKTIQPTITHTLTLHDVHHQRTPQYTKLTQDFYL